MQRSGLIAKKLGMSRVFNDAGNHIPVSVLALENCQVVAHKTQARDGYCALQMGAGTRRASRVSKAERGRYAKANIMPKAHLREFRVGADGMIDVGAIMQADHFVVGQKVDVAGESIGKGFAGAMKRHNFGGLRATHGVSISHRSHGSTGQCQDPGRVFKGKKMAGHMGDVRVSTQNLEIVRTDVEDGLILIKGAVPGAKGSWVEIRDAVKKPAHAELPLPGKFVKEPVVSEEQPAKPEKVLADEASATTVVVETSTTQDKEDGA